MAPPLLATSTRPAAGCLNFTTTEIDMTSNKQKGQGDMSVREAGRRGGEARKEALGPEG